MTTRFIVDLGDVELPEESVQELQGEIQQLVLTRLARSGFRGDINARFPREWLGIWIDRGRFRLDEGPFREFGGR